MKITRLVARTIRALPPGLADMERELLGFERLPPGRLVASSSWEADTPARYCSVCGGSALGRGCRPDCMTAACPYHVVIRLGAYVDPLAEWIRTMKFERWHAMGEVLGRQLAASIAGHPGIQSQGNPVVVPVPMPGLRRFSRGIDHTMVLAAAIAHELGWSLQRAMRQYGGPTQASRTASQRARRRNPFRPRRQGDALLGRNVMLVDDVLTTGRTARAAARRLREMGASSVSLAVLAVTNEVPTGMRRRK